MESRRREAMSSTLAHHHCGASPKKCRIEGVSACAWDECHDGMSFAFFLVHQKKETLRHHRLLPSQAANSFLIRNTERQKGCPLVALSDCCLPPHPRSPSTTRERLFLCCHRQRTPTEGEQSVRMNLLGTKCHSSHNRSCRKRGRGLGRQVQQQQQHQDNMMSMIRDYDEAVSFLQFRFRNAIVLSAIDEEHDYDDNKQQGVDDAVTSTPSAFCYHNSSSLKRSPTCGSFSLVNCV
jgi:hypothetical protein